MKYLSGAASKRGIKLLLVSPSLSLHCSNTSRVLYNKLLSKAEKKDTYVITRLCTLFQKTDNFMESAFSVSTLSDGLQLPRVSQQSQG